MLSHYSGARAGLVLVGLVVGATSVCSADGSIRPAPKKVRDVLWVWGNPEMAQGDDARHTLATYAQASPARRATLLGGVPNIVMAGRGLPDDPNTAAAQTEAVKNAARLAWEILPDSAKGGEYSEGVTFDYTRRVALLKKLRTSYPQIEAVLLDDMSSVAVRKGFKPEHLTALKKLLDGDFALWGVVYTHTLDRPGINEYVKQLDLISVWTWNAKHLVDRDKHIEHLEKTFPGKPILLGLYLYNFGGPGPMPRDMLELQCHNALRLAHEGRITGIVFLTIHNDADTMKWVADWIKRVGDEPLGQRK